MAKKALWTIVTMACVSLLAAGCGDKDSTSAGGGSSTSAPKADTPKQAVSNLVTAFDKGDKALFVRTAYFADGDTALADAFFEMSQAMMGVSKDMEKAYGKEAAGPAEDMDLPTAADVEKLEFKIEGDKATVTSEGHSKGMPLIKKGDVWMVDMSEAASGKDREMMLKSGPIIAAELNKLRAKIGKEGVSAEDIKLEMFGIMAKAAGADKGPADSDAAPAE